MATPGVSRFGLSYTKVSTLWYNQRGVSDITVRVSEEELDVLDSLAAACGGDHEAVVRAVVRHEVQQELLRVAVERYSDGEVGMRGAAAIAGLSITEMMRAANEREVLSNYDASELRRDVDALR